MDINGKIWGTTSTIFKSNNVQVTRIVGVAGGYCSKHKHDHKFNKFYVESGRLRILVWKNDYDMVDKTVLMSGQSITIKPGEYHRFEVLEDNTIAFEIYWTQLDEDDIVRSDCGGIS